MQRRFRISDLAAALPLLVLFAAIPLAHSLLITLPDREQLGAEVAELRFDPVRFDRSGFAPLRLVGAWSVTSDSRRFGGISAIAVEGDSLLALTDSGTVVRFPKPDGGSVQARLRDLPDGPGDARFKKNRDSEAIARDPGGRGWWVAFENSNELWLYDHAFDRAFERIAVPPRGLGWNAGIEGLAASGEALLLLPESGGRLLRFGSTGWMEIPFAFPPRRISGAAALGRDSLLVIERQLSLFGFANALVRLDRCRDGYCLAWRKALPVGVFDNFEAIALEPLGSGATRLWLMTDDNSNRPLRTVLIAADLPPQI